MPGELTTSRHQGLRRRSAVVLLLSAIGGCGPHETTEEAVEDAPVWTDETAWRLSEQPRLTISPGDPRQRAEGKPLDPVSVFRLRDGHYAVSDGKMHGWHAILIYDANGQFLQQLGRKGGGPAEFMHHSQWAGRWRGDSIAGYDENLKRIQIWSPTGEFARTLKLPPQDMGRSFFMSSGNAVIARIDPETWGRRGRFEGMYQLYGPDGEFIRQLMSITLAEEEVRSDPAAPNFALNRIFATGQHRWYAGEWNDFRIDVYDTSGVKLHTLERNSPRRDFPDADREAAIRNRLRFAGMGPEAAPGEIMSDLEKDLRRRARWPKSVPAFQGIIEDDAGNAWVQHYYSLSAPTVEPSDGRTRTWSVFDPDGRFLGEVVTPPRFSVSSITADQVLGFWSDEYDVKHVRVYDLRKPPLSTN